MSSLRLLFSNSYDPWFNLTVEEYLFENMSGNQYILFLWRNHNTVVIGRAQNPWKECNTRRMERDGIKLARRASGGGAVFHDLGNTCFTFISKNNNMEKGNSMNIIIYALKNLGINALLSGRNDIIVKINLEQRKISGSAYRQTKFGWLHHGTLLLNTDLNKLAYYLTPDEKKLQSKGITSVRSRIINLIEIYPDINHEVLCQALRHSFFKFYNSDAVSEIISPDMFLNNHQFSQLLHKQSSWEWNFGTAPQFTHQLNTRFMWGSISLHFDIENGIITRSCLFTDSLYPEPLEILPKLLINALYLPKDIENRCQKWLKLWPHCLELLEVRDWLVNNIK